MKQDEFTQSMNTSPADTFEGLFLHIGSTRCHATLRSSAAIALEATRPIGTRSFDQGISEHLRDRHRLVVGERILEDIRRQVGCAQPLPSELTVEIKGRSLLNGAPTVVWMTSTEFLTATERARSQVLEFVRATIAGCPPELAEVIRKHGIVVAGEGATLRGITGNLTETTGISARLAA